VIAEAAAWAADPAPARFEQLAPDACRALRGLDGALWLEPAVRELVSVRMAQLAGAAELLERHLCRALELGESHGRLVAIAGWRRSTLFGGRERAALALAEALALPVSGDTVAEARVAAAEHFDSEELAQLVFACIAADARGRLELAYGSG
jgi:alkylhydroperoxidase family enzyme